MKKIIVILGPTASGKTELAVKLADIFNGEVVSADSRQVYCGMDIGTGKDLQIYQSKNIPYHLIDVADPKEEFSLAKYQELAYIAINDILARGKLPIIVGGSGLYLQAIVDGYQLSEIKPNKKLREELEKKDVLELFSELEKINPEFAKNINESDAKNKRRLIRYIELNNSNFLKKQQDEQYSINNKNLKYESLIFNIKLPKKVLHEKIYKRLIERFEKEDMIGEVEMLHKEGVAWERLESFGLEYKYIALYLQKKLTYDEMVGQLFIAIRQFAKKQMSWFRRWKKQGTEIISFIK